MKKVNLLLPLIVLLFSSCFMNVPEANYSEMYCEMLETSYPADNFSFVKSVKNGNTTSYYYKSALLNKEIIVRKHTTKKNYREESFTQDCNYNFVMYKDKIQEVFASYIVSDLEFPDEKVNIETSGDIFTAIASMENSYENFLSFCALDESVKYVDFDFIIKIKISRTDYEKYVKAILHTYETEEKLPFSYKIYFYDDSGNNLLKKYQVYEGNYQTTYKVLN